MIEESDEEQDPEFDIPDTEVDNSIFMKIETKQKENNETTSMKPDNLPNIVQNNPNEVIATTISCPMCHTTNLRTRDDCVSCKYDLRALKRVF